MHFEHILLNQQRGKAGLPWQVLSLCGKLAFFLSSARSLNQCIKKKKVAIVMAMPVHGYGHVPQWLCFLAYLRGSPLLVGDSPEELPVHVVICVAVQWSERHSLRAQPHTFSQRMEGHTPPQNQSTAIISWKVSVGGKINSLDLSPNTIDQTTADFHLWCLLTICPGLWKYYVRLRKQNAERNVETSTLKGSSKGSFLRLWIDKKFNWDHFCHARFKCEMK